MLKDEGLTVAHPGVGTVVGEFRPTHITGAGRLDRLERTGRPYAASETTIKHRTMLRSCADPFVADALGLEPHDEVLVRSRVFVRNGVPTVLATSVIHLRALQAVPELQDGSPLPEFWQHIYTKRTGNEITRSPEERGARHAYEYELDELDVTIPKGAAVPVLVLKNVFHTEAGPIEYWEDVYAPGLWQTAG